MSTIRVMVAAGSILAFLTALTVAQHDTYEKSTVYGKLMQNDNDLTDRDASTLVPFDDPILIVLPCCDYMPGDRSGSPN